MEKVLVSACLLGARVRYHGGDAACADPVLRRWVGEGRVVAVCPEQEGGLPTPRPPAEIVLGTPADGPALSLPLAEGTVGGRAVIARSARVQTAAGADVTTQFCRGAEQALDLVKQHRIRMAVLKDGSPSCANTLVFDGHFSGTRVPGVGVTTALLEAHGVRVFNETELESAAQWLDWLEPRVALSLEP